MTLLEVLVYLRWLAKKSKNEHMRAEIDELLDCIGESIGKDIKQRLKV